MSISQNQEPLSKLPQSESGIKTNTDGENISADMFSEESLNKKSTKIKGKSSIIKILFIFFLIVALTATFSIFYFTDILSATTSSYKEPARQAGISVHQLEALKSTIKKQSINLKKLEQLIKINDDEVYIKINKFMLPKLTEEIKRIIIETDKQYDEDNQNNQDNLPFLTEDALNQSLELERKIMNDLLTQKIATLKSSIIQQINKIIPIPKLNTPPLNVPIANTRASYTTASQIVELRERANKDQKIAMDSQVVADLTDAAALRYKANNDRKLSENSEIEAIEAEKADHAVIKHKDQAILSDMEAYNAEKPIIKLISSLASANNKALQKAIIKNIFPNSVPPQPSEKSLTSQNQVSQPKAQGNMKKYTLVGFDKQKKQVWIRDDLVTIMINKGSHLPGYGKVMSIGNDGSISAEFGFVKYEKPPKSDL